MNEIKTQSRLEREATVAIKLGFRPEVRFVTFKAGRVGFTCGKPDEVRALRSACIDHGMKMTRGLQDANC